MVTTSVPPPRLLLISPLDSYRDGRGGIKFWLKAGILRGRTSQIGGDSSSVSTVSKYCKDNEDMTSKFLFMKKTGYS